MYKVNALQHGNHIYTVRRLQSSEDMRPFKYVGFIDGKRWRYFKTRKEFEEAVDLQPEDFHLGQHAREVEIAQLISETKGSELLDKIIARCRDLKKGALQ
jgi:hypothetical protein